MVAKSSTRHVAAERRARCRKSSWLPDVAVVRHVRVGHEQVVIADRRHAAAAGRAAMDRDELAEDVVMADDEPRRLAAELQVLRRQADRRERADLACGRRSRSSRRRRSTRRCGSDGRSTTCGADRRVRARRRCPRRSRASGCTIAVGWIDRRRARRAGGVSSAIDAGRPRPRPGRRPTPRAASRAIAPAPPAHRHLSSSRSPGTTWRRNFALSTPRSHARRSASGRRRRTAAARDLRRATRSSARRASAACRESGPGRTPR